MIYEELSHTGEWKDKASNFETCSLWDIIEIRFFDRKNGGNDVELITSYQRSLSSIYFDDDNERILKVHLSELNVNMSG
jgi:hypothetical protein